LHLGQKKMFHLKARISIFLIICVVVCLVACTPPLSQTQAPQLPVIAKFSSDPSNILPYYPSFLSWDVSGATIVTIDHGVGKVDPYGRQMVKPSENTTYTLAATNANGTVTASTVVSVCPTCACVPFSAPKLRGFEDYWDNTNCFWLPYPSTWIIDKERFATLNSEAGGVLSGVSFSDNKTGDDYAYFDVLLKPKGPEFDLQAYANQYKGTLLDKGYHLISEETPLPYYIIQTYDYLHNNRKYIYKVQLIENEGKLWTVRSEGPGPDNITNEIFLMHSFSILRWNSR
jgi:hypothetical protein